MEFDLFGNLLVDKVKISRFLLIGDRRTMASYTIGKNINFNVGDTNFIALVNCKKYDSFVDEDWELEMLQTRWLEENAVGNIIVCQMTDEGTEDDWVIGLEGENFECAEFLAHETSHITVTEGELCFVEYTCLTMAAQFADEYVPDSYCSSFAFEIENGEYQVDVYKLKNVDTGEKVEGERDIIFKFTKVEKADAQGKILWWGL